MKALAMMGALFLLTGCATTHEAKVDSDLGAITLPDGTTYVGDLVNGVPEGYGTLKTTEGTYTGAIKQGKAHGFGQTVTNDGAVYEGEHRHGEFHGRGKLTLSDGSFFIGQMRHNKVGKGTMFLNDGRAVDLR
ncbi:phosphatidylinositol kinase [Wohlfahrtiimonas sp. G9077]|uniref:phosphatidylinositol kinase n=1 Tax=Wohlfahrtiimonas sp. G9077 TaxID=1980118 RepID=UPI000B98DB00|nr:phosphatidylinositol kinase [Wohlfahrtiimonas sp. G9077]OYQ73344.1 phosphatidylinositol kinase [Wohlfahrtiimonas sp. G9077]